MDELLDLAKVLARKAANANYPDDAIKLAKAATHLVGAYTNHAYWARETKREEEDAKRRLSDLITEEAAPADKAKAVLG
jgi:hypothetical protein